MTKPDLCIYHGSCDDGFGAAFAIWKKYGDAVKYHPGVYQEPPPDVANLDVAIVDFSYKRPVLLEMAAKAKSILVLDHHKTAEADLAGLDAERANIRAVFDMNRSGAVMAWEHYHPKSVVPSFFLYLQDRDLWRKELPGVDDFTMALRSYTQEFEVWDRLARNVGALVKEGASIQRYYRTLIESAKGHAYFREIAGHRVPVVNASLFMSSELAGELAEGHPFAAVYAENEERVIWSLRSRLNGIDVSEIAKQFGGGGHKHAAGYSVPRAGV